ncbi:MAG: DUF447 family protein [Planctomycetia bacterium]|nr:DUF447 family protein [Planctomycetia bacterium]
MILEGILTTLNADGGVNVSPMGPIVDAELRTFTLRPFQTSTTFANLKRTGQGVFHVIDDVLLLARAAIDRLDPLPAWRPAVAGEGVEGAILMDACRWYALKVREFDDRDPRATIVMEAVASGRQRDFFGFNRAKHAVVEAAILATRVAILPAGEILAEFARLQLPIDKTGGPDEQAAMRMLNEYVRDSAVIEVPEKG